MLISELIQKLTEIKEKDGDSRVVIDANDCFVQNFDIKGKDYTYNFQNKDGSMEDNMFIIVCSRNCDE